MICGSVTEKQLWMLMLCLLYSLFEVVVVYVRVVCVLPGLETELPSL